MKTAISLSSLLIVLCLSCIKTEVLNAPEEEKADTVMTKKPQRPPHPPVPPSDTTEVEDTARVPIGFNPSVGDWEAEGIDL